MNSEKQFHVVSHHTSGVKVYRTFKPVSKEEGEAMIAGLTPVDWRVLSLEEVVPDGRRSKHR
jgi:hypothetical protein